MGGFADSFGRETQFFGPNSTLNAQIKYLLPKRHTFGKMTMEIFCRADGLCEGKGGSMHIADLSVGMLGANAIVGANAPIAVGAALKQRVLDENIVSAAFIGDGASNQGAVFESMNLASVLKLPVLFVFENNGYGEFTGVDYHCGGGDIAGRAKGFGMPSYKVDGSDFFAVQEVAAEAAKRARKGEGPTFLEAKTYRYKGHSMSDAQQYRTKKEVEEYKKVDPISQVKALILDKKYAKQSDLDAIEVDVKARVAECEKFAEASPYPEKSVMYDAVYEQTDYPFIKHKLS